MSDDGIGFDARDTHNAADKGSLGLRGMTERARLIGSELTLHSDPGRAGHHGGRVGSGNDYQSELTYSYYTIRMH